jgi:hypothetical protein
LTLPNLFLSFTREPVSKHAERAAKQKALDLIERLKKKQGRALDSPERKD